MVLRALCVEYAKILLRQDDFSILSGDDARETGVRAKCNPGRNFNNSIPSGAAIFSCICQFGDQEDYYEEI